jgi:uncharacterized protein (DUF2267 family)
MSAAGLEVFDKTLQITNTWLDEIMQKMGPDRQVAWHILRAVLHALRDRLPPGLMAHLGAQLPLLVRGVYYDQWRAGDEQQLKLRNRDEFLERVGDGLKGIRPVNVQDAVQVVFQVLNHHVEPGQVQKVREALPEAVRELWPAQPGGKGNVQSAA